MRYDWQTEWSRDSSVGPKACRPAAFEYVRIHLGSLRDTQSLVNAVTGVALHAFDDAQPERVRLGLEQLAEQVRQRCRSGRPAALVAYLHEVLFEQEGFCGTPQVQYYNPMCSYLPAVLSLKQGLPITLGLIYKAVAERVGLSVQGVGSRGHFLLRVYDGRGWMIVDPFHQGRIYTVSEACNLISQVMQEPLEASTRHLPCATNKEWLLRVIVNLAHAYSVMGCSDDHQAMYELALLVESHA